MSVRRRTERDPETGAQYEVWLVDVVFQRPDGRRTRVKKKSPVQTRRGAEDYERQIRNALLDGTFGRKEAPVPTVADFAEEFMRTYVATNNKPSEQTAKESIFRMHLLPRFGSLKLDRLDEHAIERFKADQRQAGLSNKTINNHLVVIGKMLRTAVEWKRLPAIPKMKRLQVVKPRFDFLSFEEAERLVEAAASEPEWQSTIIVALNTGLRLGELLALQWGDCDLTAGNMVVRRSDWQGQVGTTKSGKERTIPLNAKVLVALRRHRHLRGPLVWCQEDGRAYDKDNLKWALKRIVKRSGLRHFEWHVLRHTFASHLVMRGVSLKAVQELLGHSTIEMTMRYSHLSADVCRGAVDALVDPAPQEGYGSPTARRAK